ncbi:MAG TPA: hypothetical protein VD997_15995 [Phycisphaerales bacterium]|nr:hypothetical protein [Phycisphaerales bacterium]
MPTPECTRALKTLVPALLVAAAAGVADADPGELLWTRVLTDPYAYGTFPAVDPQGNVYWPNRGLWSYTREGELRWWRDNTDGPVAIRPDGAIFTTEYVNTRTAEDPFWVQGFVRLTANNEQVWWTGLPTRCAWPEAGPIVGPDGNIYGTCSGGYNAPGPAFSIHEDGWTRWVVQGFKSASININDRTDDTGRFYVRAGTIPAPNAPWGGAGGVVAIDLNGQVRWENIQSGADYVGIHYPTGGVITQQLARDPDENPLWNYGSSWTSTDTDGSVYLRHGWYRYDKLRPDGSVVWQIGPIGSGNYVNQPAFSPDHFMMYLTFGPCIGYPDTACPGRVVALRTGDGSIAWQYEFPRLPDDLIELHKAAVSPDGTRLYVTGYKRIAGHGYLMAFDTGVAPTPVCGTSDFNGDGDAGTDQDIEAFFACIGGNCCPTCFGGGADFNADGDTATDQDIEAFFRVLGGGAC